jgi:hypothetical protein
MAKMTLNKKYTSALLVGFIALGIVACGGGGGDSDNSGNPAATPTPGVGGPRTLTLHGEVERLTPNADGSRDRFAGYSICSFDECSTTNAEGEYLFSVTAPEGAVGISYTVSGPEFSAIVGFPLKATAEDVDADFFRVDGQNLLTIGKVAFDGVLDTSISPAGFNDGD